MLSGGLGHWWRPEESDRKIAGTLRTESTGPIRLELLDLLTNGHSSNRYPVVLGTTADGLPVTLEDLQQIERHSRSSRKLQEPVELETLTPRIAFLGAHLPSEEDRTFKSAVIDLTDLLLWAGPSGFRATYGHEPIEVTVSLTPPPAVETDLPLGRLSLVHGWSTTGDALRSRGIEKSVGFVVDLREPLAIADWLSRVVNPLRHLLTFATGRPNEVDCLTFTTFRYDPDHGSDVEVLYPRASHVQELPPGREFEFLFDAGSLGNAFATTVEAWFHLYSRLGPVLDLFFGPRYRPVTFMENHFLNAVGAAEGYHRATFPNTLLPKAIHRERVAAVVEAAPAGHQAWLRKRLAYSNEPSLRQRIVDLHQRAAPIVDGVIGSAAEYVPSVVRMRNSLTHRGTSTRKLPTSGRDLLRLTEQTNLLLTVCLLLDLGLDEDFAGEAIRRTRGFRLLTEASRP